MNPLVRAWLTARKSDIDRTIADGCRQTDEQVRRFSKYEWEQSLQDLLRLSDGDDCAYDRPTIGVQYALWYHGRRTETAIRALDSALERTVGPVDLLDLGCGTGAGAWAVSLIESARVANGLRPRDIHVRGVDTSAPMLDQAAVMWSHLESWRRSEDNRTLVSVDWSLKSWTAVSPDPSRSTIVFGSYLFDWSDISRCRELARTLSRVVDASNAETIVLTATRSKRKVLAAISAELSVNGRWADADPADVERQPLWSGPLEATRDIRNSVRSSSGIESGLMSKAPSWTLEETITACLTAAAPASSLPFVTTTSDSQLVLDEAQDQAATPTGRMTAILGAAGSGKSRVLIEHVARSLEEARQDRRALRVLITTFNKPLADQLWEWFVVRVASSDFGSARVSGADGDHRFVIDDRHLSVRVVNWDKVPSRVFGIAPGSCQFQTQHLARLQPVVDQISVLAGLADTKRAEFVNAEMTLVMYGLRCRSKDDYLAVSRRGRVVPVGANDRERLHEVAFGPGAPRTFTHARADTWAAVMRGEEPKGGRYDVVAVDEYQDFTLADFDVLVGLVADARQLVVAGDPAQALHLGKSSGLPGALGGRRWRRSELRGSYRLPIRVCEAIEPLARAIQQSRAGQVALAEDALLSGEEIQLPESVKTAVLGTRPVVIAGTEADVERSLRQVLSIYASTIAAAEGPRLITIAEEDLWVKGATLAAAPRGFSVATESMRRIKGLERPCVVWSTRALIPSDESAEEWIYTILSRTTSLLVIALSAHTGTVVRDVVKGLRKDRLLFWTSAAEHVFDAWQGGTLVDDSGSEQAVASQRPRTVVP